MSTQPNTSLPKTFWWHNLTQFGGAMNDNIFKLLMIYALIAWSGPEASAGILAKVGLFFALPFILIVPFAGNFADRFSKRSLIVILKFVEIGVMSFGVLALSMKIPALLYTTMFLMSAQSAFFGPCKYGILPEIVGNERLSKANGAIQLFTFLAIISGTVLAPELSLLVEGRFSLAASICLVIAALGLFTATQISPTVSHPGRKLSLNGYGSVFKTLVNVRKDSYMTLAFLAMTVFSLAAAFIQLNVLDFGFEHLDLRAEEATRLFLLTAVGIGIGSTLAGWLSGRSIEFGIVPIGAGLMSINLIILGISSHGSILLSALNMFCIGLGAGLFIVPLTSFIQYRSPEDQLGAIQAAHSFLNWIGILFASALIFLNSSILDWTAQHGFLLLGFGLLGLALLSVWILPDFFARFLGMLVTRVCYKFRVSGLNNVPAQGGALIVCNHVSMLDAILVTSSQQRRVRMLMSRAYYEEASWLTRRIADLANVILIHTADNPKKLLQSLKTAREALDEGYLVCIFAEGALTRTGMLRPFKPGFERIVKGTDYPIIPAYIGGVWGSLTSYHQGKPKLKIFSEPRYPVSLHYGDHMPSTSTAFEVQQAVNELSTQSFEMLKDSKRHLGLQFIESAREHWKKLAIADSSGRELKYGELLIGSLLLRDRIREKSQADESKIAILLPPGSGSALSNIALTFDGRVAVNLNYTAAPASIESAMHQCEIRTTITSRKFLERFPEIPLPENVLYVEDLLANLTASDKRRAAIRARLAPMKRLVNGSIDPDALATVLFSSGSTAEPKGIMLSHHNLLSNIDSFRSVLAPKRKDVMLTALPFFHSFGYTATLWFPLLSGITTTCHTNPLEGEAIGKLAETYKATLLLTTPSFLLAYARKVKPEQFANLRYVFTGAEKLQPRISDLFEKRFSIRPLEGYGATELAPVCALSLPNVIVDTLEETGNRSDRLGRTLPGIAMKIVHPETSEPLAPGEEGLICVKGPNVMIGYLNREDLTKEVLHDGWYDTGDLGLMDADGFFAITGRLSRFSKIGGEMIPHGAIEESLRESFNMEPNQLAVVAIPDAKKGEKICVLITQFELSEENIREKLQTIDLPNLWKPNPKDWCRVEALPMLGTGKQDFRAMKTLVEEMVD
jgi:acyl-[acyl-carrier-protein]-phospholipid O-acyltransferase / long-chain-fatty-acid--[acyl-carrier-protein] ligase